MEAEDNHDDCRNQSLDTIVIDKDLFSDWEMFVQETPTRGTWPFATLKSSENGKKKNVKKEDNDNTDNPEDEEEDPSYKSKMISLGEADDRETW